ncbi:DUF1146 domain-containing protein [Paenibacillus rhizovicinus]|uniref:DUF1146 domain-containing protein n=1 Tax=Paenibacillus rhizovicinus TaxID=2704463 RepID=A0A6C0P7R7_9BACL|nr:DUF1146 domain-containing protein [Paenibacillus rhizovicinus]QHW32562.1 DUF1146 domain-containing protein [Paenibacillus rhizovicinus]
MDQVASSAGMHALMSIVIELFSIALAWIVIQEIKWDAIMKRPRGPQVRLVQIVLSIVLGHGFASFVLAYWNWSGLLRGIVE